MPLRVLPNAQAQLARRIGRPAAARLACMLVLVATQAACAKSCKRVAQAVTEPDDPATLEDVPDAGADANGEPLPPRPNRCSVQAVKLQLGVQVTEVGDALAFAGGYAVAVTKRDGVTERRYVALVDSALGQAAWVPVDVRPPLGDAVHLGASADALFVAYDAAAANDKSARPLVVSKLGEGRKAFSEVARFARDADADESSFAFAVHASGAFLVAYEQHSAKRAGLRIRGAAGESFDIAGSAISGGPAGGASGAVGAIEAPKLAATATGFWGGWQLVREDIVADAGRDYNEAPGEERKATQLQFARFSRNGEPQGTPVLATQAGSRVSSFALTGPDSFVVHDDTEMASGKGTRLLRGTFAAAAAPSVAPWILRGVSRYAFDAADGAVLYHGASEGVYLARAAESEGSLEPALADARLLLAADKGTYLVSRPPELFYVRCAP